MGVMIKNKVARFFMDHGVEVISYALAEILSPLSSVYEQNCI